MQGADRVNDELEVGFDARFERRWIWVQRVGTAVAIVFVGSVIAGLMGRGPYSHDSVSPPGAGMSVDFEPVARAQTPTQITFHIRNESGASELRLFVSTTVVEPMGLERVIPQPLASSPVQSGLEMTFPVAPGERDGHVRLVVQPSGVGPIELTAQLEGHVPVRWTQTVMP
jgi:hypothetical protein